MSRNIPKLPFKQRFRVETSKPLEQQFPETGRLALAYLTVELHKMGSIRGYDASAMLDELLRTARSTYADLDLYENTPLFEKITTILKHMEWWQVYTACERLYEKHVDAAGYLGDNDNFIETRNKAETQSYFEDEINNILNEENISYQFVRGQFQNRGRAQTQKSVQRVGSVLLDPRLSPVLQHYNKAQKFFNQRPEPDGKNCVKEAVCALEATIHVLTNSTESIDFTKAIKGLQGNGTRQIPPPIAEGIIRLYAYRGSGQGVAHAAPQGNKVTEIEAELVLSLVASYVTYLVDLLAYPDEEIPF